MRPVPIDVIPEWAVGEHWHKIIVAGPSGDLTDDVIRPVEALVGPVTVGEEIAPAFHIKVEFEPEDLKKIESGTKCFWLILYGSRIQPFAVEMDRE